MTAKAFLALMLTAICLASTEAALADGTSFLLVVPGGRAGSLGGAFTAVADDAEAIYYNPAGLSLQSDPEAGVMYQSRGESFFSKNHFVSVDLFLPTERYGIGGGLLYENRPREGSDEPSYSLCGILSTGSTIGARIAFGLGARYLRSVEESRDASAVGGDLGLLLNLSPVILGFSMQSWQGSLDYGTIEEVPPDILRFSIAYVEPGSGAPLALEYRRVDREGESTINAGVEIPVVQKRLFLRTGYIRNADSGGSSFVLGLGLRVAEQDDASTRHPLGFELNVYDNLSSGGLRDLRVELRRRRL
jgi:hypothetical protein